MNELLIVCCCFFLFLLTIPTGGTYVCNFFDNAFIHSLTMMRFFGNAACDDQDIHLQDMMMQLLMGKGSQGSCLLDGRFLRLIQCQIQLQGLSSPIGSAETNSMQSPQSHPKPPP